VFIDDLDSPGLGESGVLLYSGGADSTLLAHSLIRRGKHVIGVSIDYPGRPAAEIAIAKRIAGRIGFTEHLTIELGLPWHAQRGEAGGLNEGWFPHRNLMFLSVALHVAEIRSAHFVAAGYARTDGIIFSDATPGFLKLFNTIAAVSSGRRSADREIGILVPFLEKDAFFRGEAKQFPDLPALIAETWSCWRDESRPCGVCAACRERAYYFEAVGADRRPGDMLG
jgi:7-cyano-7-deazaguanine synthase